MTTTTTRPLARTSLPDLLESAGLTGRGGAAFSTATKLRAAHDHDAALIVNACDGELGAAKDAWVVEHHLAELVEGARLVTRGRSRPPVRYAAHRGSATAHRLAAAGLDVLPVPGRYVSSEETALISLAQGGLARPMTKRAPFVLGGRDSAGRRIAPTVVLNAETVWRVAQIDAHGPDWFRSQGLPGEPGPRLVSIGGYVRTAGVAETETGVALTSLLDRAGGLAPDAVAVLIGGLGGILLTAAEARGAIWSSADLARFGGSLGPGVVTVLDPRVPGTEAVSGLLRYAAGESAGQCGPCMFGLPALARAWDDAAAGVPGAGARLTRQISLLPGRGACRFPDGVARMAWTASRVFAADLEGHGGGRS